tara:strand:- start:1003 stop:1191 length:189 start_codon:yes stop_codon:yes gene_type:complete
MKLLRKIKTFFKFLGEMAQAHHDMEVGRLKCLKCKNNTMKVVERGILPVGICKNCGFELKLD